MHAYAGAKVRSNLQVNAAMGPCPSDDAMGTSLKSASRPYKVRMPLFFMRVELS